MNRIFLALLFACMGSPVWAALKVGDAAPDFSTQATLGGKEFSLHLSKLLKDGPVVLYFYPAAFTKGCTIEAHDFATAMPQFKALGATVIGVSSDTIETLNKFSVSECQSKFAVASDSSQSIMKSYDAVLLGMTHYASRISYVIAADGKIAYSYASMNPDQHVANTIAALQALKALKH